MTTDQKNIKKQRSFDADFYTVKPSAGVKFLRSFWPWQFIRFLFINLKMMRMISKSHAKKYKG